MTRALHRWTWPNRPSAFLSIRSCTRCGLVMHSRHEVEEFYAPDASDVRMTVMPECVKEKVGSE